MPSIFFRTKSESLFDLVRCRVQNRKDTFLPAKTMILTTLLGIIVSGCISSQKPIADRAEKCGELCARAREAREKGNLDQANRSIDEAASLSPNDAETCRLLAESMWNNGRRSEAVARFTSLCKDQPNDDRLACRLAIMQWETEQYSAAEKTANAVLSRSPALIEAWRVKARCEARKGPSEDALVSYLRLSQLAPDDFEMLTELGELHLKRGCPDRACPLLKSAVQHPRATESQRDNAAWMLGTAYAKCKRWSLAVSVLEPLAERRETTADDLCLLGWNRMLSGDLDGAQADLQSAIERDPESKAAKKLALQLEKSKSALSKSKLVTPASFQDALED